MPDQLTERLDLLSSSTQETLLTAIKRGIEKESLRISPSGELSQMPHPNGLGSALTHNSITTDFSEALLELITPASTSIDGTLGTLSNIHRFVYAQLDNEELWCASMPCILGDQQSIPIAEFGSSNVAQMKNIYRKGLGNRYGRTMQTIAGIHYNFSIPEELWLALKVQDHDKRPLKDYVTDSYFKLIRNFRRFSWLLVYLYGASPAVCKSFLSNRDHQLKEFDVSTAYLPFATSLRMSDLGYQSSAQDNLEICYNSIDNYIETLRQAITNTHPAYKKIDANNEDQYQQLSAGLLQIENEFYSPIRPKRVTSSGETPIGALRKDGVEYIEVRCIDVNPSLPLGIDEDQIRFIDCFLLYCLFEKSPLCFEDEIQQIKDNLNSVVEEGRNPNLKLHTKDGSVSLKNWATEILDGVEKIAKQLDMAHGGNNYVRVCEQQRLKIIDSSLTPSAKILATMREKEQSFAYFALELSKQHGAYFRQRPLSPEQNIYYQQETELSILQQKAIEANDDISFDQYLESYYRQYDDLH